MSDEILKECWQAKERVAVLFGDVDALMDFIMKRWEQRIKQVVKYVDFSLYRKKMGKIRCFNSFGYRVAGIESGFNLCERGIISSHY